jgi:hypothetical protein
MNRPAQYALLAVAGLAGIGLFTLGVTVELLKLAALYKWVFS